MAGVIEVRTFTGTGFGENAYLARHAERADAVAIDPGAGTPELIDALRAGGHGLAAILLTHAHVDHVDGVAALVEATGAPVYLHADARGWYDRAGAQGAMFGVNVAQPPPPDHTLAGGTELSIAGLRFQVRDAPGHAPGHVILYAPEGSLAFVGDVIFQGSIGRTDLPGGDFQELMRSIREQVLTLPDETALYPGHGPATTVAHERASNPFLVPYYRGGLA